MNAEFQRIARRDKKAFLSDQCKEIEENNRMGKTRDLFKKIRDTKGTRVSVPLRVVPSSTGLPFKRCPGIRFLSRVDRGIGVFQHVLPPMKLHLKYSR